MTEFSETIEKILKEFYEANGEDYEYAKRHSTRLDNQRALVIEGFKAGQKSKLSEDFIDMIQETARKEGFKAGQSTTYAKGFLESLKRDARKETLEEVIKEIERNDTCNCREHIKIRIETMKSKEAI
jgi:hypothetical protein